MAAQRLEENGTTVDFSPLVAGYIEDVIQDTPRHRSKSNKLYSYQFATDKWRYEIPVVITTAADAVQINTWAKDNTALTFYYDYTNEPTMTKTVLIVNEGDPLQMTAYKWEDRYQGIIILEEI